MLILLSAAAGQALADTEVRFLHAVPGGPGAEVQLSGGGAAQTLSGIAFGEASEYGDPRPGPVTVKISAGGSGLGQIDVEGDGRYTVVAASAAGGEEPKLTVFRDGSATPAKTRWRMVHVAPELERTEFTLDGRPIGELGLNEASDYSTVEPGTRAIGARRPGEEDPLVETPDAALVAGTAQTAYLVGSGGERTRFVVLEDDTAAPEEAPDTGLGGLNGGGVPWLLVLAATLLAGTLGALAYLRATSRGSSRT